MIGENIIFFENDDDDDESYTMINKYLYNDFFWIQRFLLS